jgi:catecholate siderophore receptor
MDLAGRIAERLEVYVSYSYIPVAKIDESTGAPGTEIVGSRPGLTPRHSGTLWSTYQLAPRWRAGAGLNLRSRDMPVGLPTNSQIRAPGFVTGDLMLEYTVNTLAVKANLTNVTDEHYAETIYRGHYIPGKPRTLEVTVSYEFQ